MLFHLTNIADNLPYLTVHCAVSTLHLQQNDGSHTTTK